MLQPGLSVCPFWGQSQFGGDSDTNPISVTPSLAVRGHCASKLGCLCVPFGDSHTLRGQSHLEGTVTPGGDCHTWREQSHL